MMIYACIRYVSYQAAAVSQLSIWLDHMVTSWQQWHNLPCLPCFIYVEMCLSVLYLSFLFYHTCYCWSILPRISHPWQQWHNLPCLPCFIYVETGLPVLCLIFLFYHTCYCWSPLPRVAPYLWVFIFWWPLWILPTLPAFVFHYHLICKNWIY